MEFAWKNPDEKLPNNGEYVLIWVPDRPWISESPHVFFKVAQFRKGLSEKERESLSNSDLRKKTFSSCDEWGNNQRGYNWDEFGPGQYFGQEVKAWCRIKEPK